MDLSQRLDRQQFLTLALSSTASFIVGCSDDGTTQPMGVGGGGLGGGAGNGGAGFGGGGAGAGNGGSAGTFPSAGTSGESGGGGAGGSAGGTAGGAGSGGSAGAAPNCEAQLTVLITADHGHSLMVTAADVMAGIEKVYDTQGTSNHPHWIKLTAADFSTLQGGGTVRKLSCNDGHEHEFVINCVGNTMPQTTSGIPQYCDAEHSCGDGMGNACPELPEGN